ncbi:MAG: hypothetical protein H6852_04405 [Geminicoccaceae bacterium]|nr:hypothetical protein [Geminicoccaceae bacterium]HRY27340.1 hypothetical protein [Geminicoccaceae bacterium]
MTHFAQLPGSSRGTVAGHFLPPPRPTRWAVLYALALVGLPLVLALLLLDAALYLVFTRLLDRCYGLLCFLS